MSLFSNEIVYDDSNYKQLCGDGKTVKVGNESFLLARTPPPHGYSSEGFSKPYGDSFTKIPRSEWPDRIKEQIRLKSRVSDHIDFEQFYQNGLPTCWAICTAQAATATLRIAGQPYRKLSGCSLAVPISGGHRGGYEGNSVELGVKRGIATVETWPENNTDDLDDDPRVIEDRKNNQILDCYSLGDDFDMWATMCLNTQCGPFAYDWMSHCMMVCDLVEIEKDSYGLRVRNTWKPWGAKNELGFDGFAVYREGRGTPDSGYVIRSMTSWSGIR